MPLPPILVERNDVGFEKYLMVGIVHFVGLDLHLTSCMHIYIIVGV
jgi:hypothetical protein